MAKKIDPQLDLKQLREFQILLKQEKELLFDVPEARTQLKAWLLASDQQEIKRKIFSIKVLEELDRLLSDPNSSAQEILRYLEAGNVWSECWQEPRLAAEKAKGKAAQTWRKVYEKSIEIRNEVCLRYVDFSGWVADRYCSSLLDREELQSQAFIGLIRACERFDPDRGTSFSNYAKVWMRDFVMYAVRRQNVVAPGAQHYKEMSRLDKACADLSAKLGREPFSEELAEVMGYSLEKLEELQGSHLSVTSLDLPLDGEGSEDGETLESVIGEEGAAPFERMEREKISARLSEHLKGLTEMERVICGFRWTSRLESEMKTEPVEIMKAIERMREISFQKMKLNYQ
ncbi:MAG: sigma-70 family RNA polymerase sigma factor [Verrucomicrobiota bacterium]